MLKNLLSSILLGLLALGWVGSVKAEEAYVSNLSITVRRGPGIDYKIIAFLAPGDQVEMVRAESGWAKILYGQGKSGWVLQRFLTEEPPLSHQAEALQAERKSLEEAVRELETVNQALKDQTGAAAQKRLAADDSGPEASPEELGQALELARNLVVEEEAKLKGIRQRLTAGDELGQWFLIGSGVAGLGMVLGFLTARFQRTRPARSS